MLQISMNLNEFFKLADGKNGFPAHQLADLYSIDCIGHPSKHFYIYDNIERRFIETLTSPRPGVIVYSPALFEIKLIGNVTTITLVESEDIRTEKELFKLYAGILVTVATEYTTIRPSDPDFDEKSRYKIIYKDQMNEEQIKENTITKYNKEFHYGAEESIKMEDKVRSICQLFGIFPNREFYIYNIKHKRFLCNSDDEYRTFIYKNDALLEKIDDEYKNFPFTTAVIEEIYAAFFVNKDAKTDYEFVRKDKVKEEKIPIEKQIINKFKEHNISNSNDIYAFYLHKYHNDPFLWM